jgi:deoxyribonuclease-4
VDIVYLGCHISVGKGLYQAAQKAIELGAESFQVFSKNPRSLRPKKLDEQDAEKARAFCQENGLKVIVHTPYITNLSSPDAELQRLTISSLLEDLRIAEAFGSPGAIVHCGKHVGEGEEKGFLRMVETLNLILKEYHGPVKLLLENTAGQGSELGLTVQELMRIRQATDYPEKIGFCFDTCHAFAAGIWNDETYTALVDEMEESGYLKEIVAIHFNDSKAPYNSRKDRHEKIGQGEIGAKPLSKFLKDRRFNELPVILETPVEDEIEYKDEILFLKKLQA